MTEAAFEVLDALTKSAHARVGGAVAREIAVRLDGSALGVCEHEWLGAGRVAATQYLRQHIVLRPRPSAR